MTKQIHWTYRPLRLTSPFNMWEVTLNWNYTPAMFLNNQFGDWNAAGLTNIKDSIIPEDRYTSEIVPWIKKLTRFLVFEYDEKNVDPQELSRSAENVWRQFDVDMITADEAYEWIKSNTDLKEVEPRKFLISEETKFMEEIIPAVYLIIE